MKKTCGLLVAFVLIAGTHAAAQNFQRPARSGGMENISSLTQEQRDQIRDMRLQWDKERAQIEADRKVARIELQEMLADDAVSEAKIREQLKKVADITVALKMGQIKLRRSAKKILTPEQLEQLQQRLRLEKFDRHGRNPGKRHGKNFRPGMRGHVPCMMPGMMPGKGK